MRDHLILLPGWGLGSAPLEPLRDALHEREPHLNVLIEPLPSLDDAATGSTNSTITCRAIAGWPAGRWEACSPANWRRAAVTIAGDC